MFYKKLSDLISDLQDVLEEHGDIPVASTSNPNSIMSTAVWVQVTSCSEDDQRFLIPLEDRQDHCRNWAISKDKVGKNDQVIVIFSDSPDLEKGGDIVEGVALPALDYDDKELDSKIEELKDIFEHLL